ncbi:MAG: hypothetical protein SGJ07_03840 [Rhodospirillaceae bacterium]|nr:hypothetical protein [Rhodospirillaceae bacterium]
MHIPHIRRRYWLAAILAGVALTLETDAVAEQEAQQLGTVEFSVSCNEAAQQKFNHAMALYHSFAWPAAMEAFESVAVEDPECGMAHWGQAMTLLGNPFVWPTGLSAEKLADVVSALDAARAAGLGSPREKDYVEAVAVFVLDHEQADHAHRMKGFNAAMADLAARYPDDMEATILSALMTSASFDPTDKGYTNQLSAARILTPIFETNPQHPGVAHYLIHSYDYPPIAAEGLPAARAYSSIAPDAAHALHMPSHIFTRLGHWHASIEANLESARVAGDATFDGHHASDYMVYAHLQLAQDEAARNAMEASLGMKPIDNFGAAYAYAAMPARLALEREDWSAAAQLTLTPDPDVYPWEKYPHAEAVNAFARGIGAALSGDATAAREQAARLATLRDAAEAAKLGYWVEQIDIQAALVAALALCVEGDSVGCIDQLRQASVREDATEKHAVTPGPIVPARELLADMLMRQGLPADAMTEYEAVLMKEPYRFRAMAGAMTAAHLIGEDAKARALAAELVELGSEADRRHTSLDLAGQLAGG